MKKFSNQKKIILGSIIGVLVGTLLSVSYAMFTYSREGTSNSKLIVGDIYMKYKDTNKEILLQNAMPSTSSAGGDYFEFEITGKNTSSNTIYYELLLSHGDVPNNKTEENRIADEFLRFKLVEVTNNVEGNDLLVNNQYYTIDKERIYVGTIPTTNQETTTTYRLYCWIDNSLVIGEDYSQSEWNNLFASIGVDVVGDFTVKTVPTYALITYDANGGKIRPSKKQLSTTATTYGTLVIPTPPEGYEFDGWYTDATNGTKVESSTTYTNGTSATTLYAHWKEQYRIACPGEGCYYTNSTNSYFTTWNTINHTPTTFLLTDLKTDYISLASYGSYYAIKLNDSNQADQAYVCLGSVCIEGTYNDNPNKSKIQTLNLEILNKAGNCNGSVGSNISCTLFGANVTLDSNGSVSMTIPSLGYKTVSSNGYF